MAHFSCNFFSDTLQRDVTVNVIVPEKLRHSGPPCGGSPAPYPVLYFIHGGANDGTTIQRYTSIERYAEEYRIAVVLLSSENKYSRKLISTIPQHPDGAKRMTEDFGAFITQELPEFVKAHFPVSDQSKDTYICGLSAGGYGTLINSLMHPEKFNAVGLFSPLLTSRAYLMSIPEEQRKGLADLTEGQLRQWFLPEITTLLDSCAKNAKSMPRYYITSGTREFAMMPYQSLLRQDMERAGIDVTYCVSRPFGHEWGLWDLAVQDFLNWIPRTDAYAQTVLEVRENGPVCM